MANGEGSKVSAFNRFIANTLCVYNRETIVATDEGDKPISQIQIGDYVLAWDEETGDISFYPVTDTIHHTDEVVVYLTIDGEEIETTTEHPFYVEGEDWVQAEDLEVGDNIRNADGETGEVELIEFEQTQQEMYNLTVDEAHTFYVGDGQWLVHNSTCNIYISEKWDQSKSVEMALNHTTTPGERAAQDYVMSNLTYRDMRSHTLGAMDFADAIANKMDVSTQGRILIARFGLVHDIGKSNPYISWWYNSAITFNPATMTHIRDAHMWEGVAMLRDDYNVASEIWKRVGRHHPDYKGIGEFGKSDLLDQIFHAGDLLSAGTIDRSYRKGGPAELPLNWLANSVRDGYASPDVWNFARSLFDDLDENILRKP